MGKLVYFQKNEEGVVNEIESILDAADLDPLTDFEIASMVVITAGGAAFSLGGYLGIKCGDCFTGESGYLSQAEELLRTHGRDREAAALLPTPYEAGKNIAFYRMKESIDMELAVEVGLGVVRHRGEYMIYSPNLEDDPMAMVYEMLRLKVYFQLKHPDQIDERLKGSLDKNADLITSLLLPGHGWKLMRSLQEIYGLQPAELELI